MNPVISRALPEHALLFDFHAKGDYADCFTIDVAGKVSLQEYVEAFYTCWLFKLERLLLRWLVAKPSSDQHAEQLAAGLADNFAAWTVEGRLQDQLLLRDYQGRTRSWLMVEPITPAPGDCSRLYFGSGVVSGRDKKTGFPVMPLTFRLMLGFHRCYSRALVRSAAAKL